MTIVREPGKVDNLYGLIRLPGRAKKNNADKQEPYNPERWAFLHTCQGETVANFVQHLRHERCISALLFSGVHSFYTISERASFTAAP